MAELNASSSAPISAPWTSAQSRAQLVAVAWMRWRVFLNNFRRSNKKRGVTGTVLIVLLRIVVWTIVGCFLVGPIAGCGLAAYYRPGDIGMLLWIVFSIHLFISLNVVPGAIGFDLTPLLRFPIRFSDYLLIRLFFGLFSIPTIVANLCLAAAAVGLGLNDHRVFLWAALVLGVYAINNVFFIRMVLAWVDRWMATRRAREILGALVLVLSLSFQLVAAGARRHAHAMFGLLHRLAQLHPWVQYLPPGLATGAILDRYSSRNFAANASLLGLTACAIVFLAILAARLKREFRGENLSETGGRAVRSRSASPADARIGIAAGKPVADIVATTSLGLPSTIAACLQKELLYLKRSGAQLYGLITPLFFVFVLSRTNRFFGNSGMLLTYAVSYVMFGLLAGLYNVLGADGAGFSLYLLAPVRLRDVMLAKNLVNGGVIVTEVLLATLAVSLILGRLPPASVLVATFLWAVFALLLNLTVGNLRSLLSPMRFELGKVRRPPMAKGGVLISLGVMFAGLGTGIPVIAACRYFGHPWLATPIFVVLDAAALFAYLVVFSRIDTIAADHRDDLTEALCKV
jgi:ABC-2 type transport system permease protein